METEAFARSPGGVQSGSGNVLTTCQNLSHSFHPLLCLVLSIYTHVCLLHHKAGYKPDLTKMSRNKSRQGKFAESRGGDSERSL